MTIDGKLSISILSRTQERAMKVLEALVMSEKQNGTEEFSRSANTLYTPDAIYQITDPLKHKGRKADQLIVDYTCCDLEICDRLLHSSCVPYEFQIIDDKDLLYH